MSLHSFFSFSSSLLFFATVRAVPLVESSSELLSAPVVCYTQLRFGPGFELGCFRPLAGALRFRYHVSNLCQFTPTIPIEPDLSVLITYPFLVYLLFIYSTRHEMLTDVSPLSALRYICSLPFLTTSILADTTQHDTTQHDTTIRDTNSALLGFADDFQLMSDLVLNLFWFFPTETCGSGTIAPTCCHSIDVDFAVFYLFGNSGGRWFRDVHRAREGKGTAGLGVDKGRAGAGALYSQ